MRRLRRCVGLAGLLLAMACGPRGAGPDTTLSAAGTAGAEPASTVTSSSSTTTAVPATVAPTTTVRRPAPTVAPTTAAPRTVPPPVPAPTATVLTVAPETISSVQTTVTQGSTVVGLRAVREQYLGEKVYALVEATSAERISSIQIDFGDGYVTTDPQTLPSTLLTGGSMSAAAIRAHVYQAPGRYRITVTLTVVPGVAAPMPPSPPTELQWFASGPAHTVTVSAELRQRPDAAPPGYPRLPAMTSE